ncbi:MAG: hypothetical protein OEZ36_05245 [Spirochaetota bacterium]|nr:hypothetical protein [Spirochaetota bacterium]
MAQKLSFKSVFITSKGNLDDAKAVLVADWTALTTAEKDTWLANKQFAKDIDGKATFMDYFLKSFAASNSNTVRFVTITLAAGTSKNYADRATRTWSAA